MGFVLVAFVTTPNTYSTRRIIEKCARSTVRDVLVMCWYRKRKGQILGERGKGIVCSQLKLCSYCISS